ncbi:MAG: hypothetical protein GDA54_00835 [Alphaproteobacteria bacterium GM7ARS4]|nr:hypothetical protein [Alphaproteobacteria bacterium GM7ARS4]
MGGESIGYLLYMLILLALVLRGMSFITSMPRGDILRYVMIWCVIAGVCAFLYALLSGVQTTTSPHEPRYAL